MSNYASLKSAIQQAVKTNGNNEITGDLLQQTLLAMVNSLGAGYQCMGVAVLTPTPTNPGTPDANVFYIASEPGTYANFGNIVINDGEVCLLTYNGTWSKRVTGAATASQLNQGLQSVVSSLKKGYLFGGMVSPADSFTAGDERMFFVAAESGRYPAFGNFTVHDGEVCLFMWDTQWTKKIISFNNPEILGVLAHADATVEKKLETLAELVIGIISGTVLVEKLNVRNLGVWGDNNLVVVGSGAPTAKPDRAGQIYIDKTNNATYKSTGNSAVSDWKTI